MSRLCVWICLGFLATRVLAAPPSASWPLVWRDEFEGIALDLTHWKAGALPWGGRHHNDEYASYIMPEDAFLQNGSLVLRSRKGTTRTSFGGYPYSEGFVHTDGKFNYTHGYAEIRAKFPKGKGVWPAFWTLPQGWPPEFDIAEYFGSDDRMHMGLAYGVCCPATWNSGNFYQLGVDAWHTYGLEWGPGYAIFYRDSRPMRAIYANYVPAVPMYLILNSGTRWDADATTPFPNEFRVDSIRVYRLPSASVNDATLGSKANQFNFSGKWDYFNGQNGAFFNDNHWSGVANDSYTVSFKGTRVDLYGARDPSHGIAAVSIDGGPESKIDFYATSRADMSLVWSSGFLSAGNHVLKVRVTGTKHASSKGFVVPADRVDVWTEAKALNGTPIGTTGSWNGSGNTRDKAFNGSLADFFDAPNPSGAWVGLDLGPQPPSVVAQLRFSPRPGFADRMLNGVFQGANRSDFSDATDLHRIAQLPYEETLNSVSLSQFGRFRYLRYLGPPNGHANIAELEFVGADPAVFALQAPTRIGPIPLEWSRISGATDYTVWRSTSATGAFTELAHTTSTSHTDATAQPGIDYFYFVTASLSGGRVSASDVVGPTVSRPAPRFPFSISAKASTVILEWPEWVGAITPTYSTNLIPPIQWWPLPGSQVPQLRNGLWHLETSITQRPGMFFKAGP